MDVVRSAVGAAGPRDAADHPAPHLQSRRRRGPRSPLAWWLTFWIRFDQSVPFFYQHLLSWQTFAIVIGIKLAVFVLFGFYNRWWRYVSTRDMWGAARGVVVASLLVDLILYAFPPDHTRGCRAGSR